MTYFWILTLRSHLGKDITLSDTIEASDDDTSSTLYHRALNYFFSNLEYPQQILDWR